MWVKESRHLILQCSGSQGEAVLPSVEHLAMSRVILVVTMEGELLLAFSGKRPRMLLDILRSSGQTHTTVVCPRTSIVSRVRNLFLKVKNNGCGCVMKKALGQSQETRVLIPVFPLTCCRQVTSSVGLDFFICNVKGLGKIFTVPSTSKSHD